tara:strand:- start:295 stop:585 length:291 start_codon:yes stop_codon:yes gene_type:complete
MAKMIYDDNPNMLVPYYLIHSYLYYEKDNPIVSDEEYDRICKMLYESYDTVKHCHKHLIDKETLLSGTGFHLKYNSRIRGAAIQLIKVNKENEIQS